MRSILNKKTLALFLSFQMIHQTLWAFPTGDAPSPMNGEDISKILDNAIDDSSSRPVVEVLSHMLETIETNVEELSPEEVNRLREQFILIQRQLEGVTVVRNGTTLTFAPSSQKVKVDFSSLPQGHMTIDGKFIPLRGLNPTGDPSCGSLASKSLGTPGLLHSILRHSKRAETFSLITLGFVTLIFNLLLGLLWSN